MVVVTPGESLDDLKKKVQDLLKIDNSRFSKMVFYYKEKQSILEFPEDETPDEVMPEGKSLVLQHPLSATSHKAERGIAFRIPKHIGKVINVKNHNLFHILH